jgi:hypothetical protein
MIGAISGAGNFGYSISELQAQQKNEYAKQAAQLNQFSNSQHPVQQMRDKLAIERDLDRLNQAYCALESSLGLLTDRINPVSCRSLANITGQNNPMPPSPPSECEISGRIRNAAESVENSVSRIHTLIGELCI